MRVSRRFAIPLALVSGALYWLAFPPFDAWPLAFIAWVPLLLAIETATPRAAFALGALQGIVCFAAAPWLAGAIARLTGFSLLPSAGFALVVCAYHAIRTGLAAVLVTRAAARGWSPLVAFPLCVAATEFAYPMIFPWYAAGQVTGCPVLMQLADVGGPVLISAALALVNVAIATWATAPTGCRRGPAILAVATPALMVAYGAARIRDVDARMATSERAWITVVQANAAYDGSEKKRALRAYLDATEAADASALVVWPETALGDPVRDAEMARHWSRLRGDRPARAAVLTGALVQSGGDALYNAALLFERDGHLAGRYDKRRPLMLGEYLPGERALPALRRWIPRAGNLTAGTSGGPLHLGAHAIAPLICYEDLFPAPSLGEAPELFVTLTNDAWLGRSSAWAIHLALARLRAVEHRRFVVRATNDGGTAFIDAAGRITAAAAPFTEATVRGEIRWMSAPTLYERIGDAPWGIVTVAVLFMAIVARPRLARRSADATCRA
jgi:apolipoprotein N-acyltransferase